MRRQRTGLVVSRVEVDSIPAGREKHLGAHAVGAVLGEEIVALLPVRVARVRLVVVQADERDGLVGKRGAVERPSVRVTGDHAKTLGEGHDLLVLVARPLEVVRSSVVGDGLVGGSDGVDVVELRRPVGRLNEVSGVWVSFGTGSQRIDEGTHLVNRNGSCRALALLHVVMVVVLAEPTATRNRVDVAGDAARRDDGVQTRPHERGLVEDEEGLGGGEESEEREEKGSRRGHDGRIWGGYALEGVQGGGVGAEWRRRRTKRPL